jgi:hypothetical protein
MLAACYSGHLHIAQWLVSVGGGADLQIANLSGETPLTDAFTKQATPRVAHWLICHGAASDESGHVNPELICACPQEKWSAIRGFLESFLRGDRTSFVHLVLPAVRFGAPVLSLDGSTCPPAKKRNAPPEQACPLMLFRGHEESILVTIADYVGVARGRPLRHMREAVISFSTCEALTSRLGL